MISIHKASAGSGKTFNLVFEYIKLLIGIKQDDGTYILNEKPYKAHQYILAITFTNKATEEMKQRIVKELDLISKQSSDSDHIKNLAKTFNTTEEKVAKSASTALFHILSDYSNFNVSTIDSFFQTILRAFAFDMEISGNYNVELNEEYAFAVGISGLKRDLHTGKANDFLFDWLKRYMENSINHGDSWNLLKDSSNSYNRSETLMTFVKELNKETVQNHHEEMIGWISENGSMQKFQERLKEIIKENSNFILKQAEKIYDFIDLDSELRVHFNAKAKNATNKYINGTDPRNTLYNTYCKIGVDKFLNKDGREDPKLESKRIQLSELITQIYDAFVNKFTAEAILSNVYKIGLLGKIEANINTYNKDNNTILLANTNEIINRIIDCKDVVPYIYERVGTRIRHFLIDEFQDTSKMQWANLSYLLEESIANNHDNLIIGDVKQSIYRFRNSDPHLLKESVEQQFKGKIYPNKIPNTNWRSDKNIVLFNNFVFTKLAESYGMTDVYSDVAQAICPKHIDTKGHISLTLVADKEACIDATLNELTHIFKRGYRPCDVAILVNTNTEGRDVIKRLINFQPGDGFPNITINSEESLQIINSGVVRTVLSILNDINRLSLQKADSEQEENKRKIYAPEFVFEYEYYRNKGLDIQEILKNIGNNTNTREVSRFVDKSDILSLDAIVDRIISSDFINKEQVIEQTPYIQAFKDEIALYMDTYGSNLDKFLKWWDDTGNKKTISSPQSTNAINIMTIHKSKGLEFPCVIVPFCNWDMKPGGNEITWIETKVGDTFDSIINPADKERVTAPPIIPVKMTEGNKELPAFRGKLNSEYNDACMDILNKTYVAFTRAGNELIMFAPKPKDSSLKQCIHAEMLKVLSKEATEFDLKIQSDEGFEIGEPQQYTPDKKEIQKAENVQIMPPYTLFNNEDDKKRYILKIPTAPVVTEKQEEGIIKHKIMERVKVATDVERATLQLKVKGFITASEQKKYTEEIKEALKDPRVQEWFAPGVTIYNEREMKCATESKHYRADRIVVTPDNRTIVIDYKFGEIESAEHIEQVSDYMKILQTLGFQNLEGYIWYVTDGIIKDVNI